MENRILQDKYEVKSLSPSEKNEILKLCISSKDYYELHEGIEPTMEEVEEMFEAVPGTSKDDRFIFGVFKDGTELVGLIDILANYPKKNIWMIGLLLLVPAERRKGLGTVIHEAISEWVCDLGGESLRIGVLPGNSAALGFWTGLGYEKDSEVTKEYKNKTHLIHIMTKSI